MRYMLLNEVTKETITIRLMFIFFLRFRINFPHLMPSKLGNDLQTLCRT